MAESLHDNDTTLEQKLTNFRLGKSQADKLRVISVVTGVNRSEHIRRAIDASLERYASGEFTDTALANYAANLSIQTEALRSILVVEDTPTEA